MVKYKNTAGKIIFIKNMTDLHLSKAYTHYKHKARRIRYIETAQEEEAPSKGWLIRYYSNTIKIVESLEKELDKRKIVR